MNTSGPELSPSVGQRRRSTLRARVTHLGLPSRLLIATLASSIPAAAAGAKTELIVSRSGFVDTAGGGKLYYEDAGNGPVLVLISGGSGMDLREWDRTFEQFIRTHRVIRYDPRGIGRSASPTGPFSHVEDLLGLLDRFRIPRAHIVGLSFAGGVAVDFAIAHPDRVSSLVLISSSLSGFAYSEEFRRRNEALRSVLEEDGVKAFVDAVFKDPHLYPTGSGSRTRARTLLRENAKTALATDPSWVRSLEPPAIGRLSEIRVPTLVIAGELDHPEVHRVADTLVAQIAGARKSLVRKTGHTVIMESPRKFANLLLGFLRGQSSEIAGR